MQLVPVKELYQAWRCMSTTQPPVEFFYTALAGLPTAIREKVLEQKNTKSLLTTYTGRWL